MDRTANSLFRKLQGSAGYLAFLLLTVVSAPLLSEWLSQHPLIRQYEEQTVGHRLSLRTPAEPSGWQPIYLLQDDLALSRLGPHPWNRRAYADYLTILHKWSKPSAIGFDYVFDDKGHIFAREGNRRFAEALAKHPQAVLSAAYSVGYRNDGQFIEFPFTHDGYTDAADNPLPSRPESELRASGNPVGLINVIEPGLQLMPAFAETPEGTYYALPFVIASLHLGLDPQNIDHDRRFVYLRDESGNAIRRIPLERGQLLRVNWLRPWHLAETHSLYDISYRHAALESTRRDFSKLDESLAFFESLEDRIVLIAPGDSLSKDLSPNPLDVLAPRVSVIGNSIETILAERFLRPVPAFWRHLLTALFACLICGALIWERLPPLVRHASAFIWLVFFVALSYLSVKFDYILPLVAPASSLTAVSLIAFSAHMLVIERKRSAVQRLFQSYVAPNVVRQLLKTEGPPALGGQEQVITALFTDIQGFSTFSEKADPAALVQFLNAYMDDMTRPVLRNQGTLDKYIGDALVAFFGAPGSDPQQACHAMLAACEMMRNEERMNREWPHRQPTWPLPVHTRIGISTGPAIVGNMGSSIRFNYTMMGDTVNTAKRLESAAAKYGVQTLVSGETIASLTEDQRNLFVLRKVDQITLKGRQSPTEIWQLLGLRETTA